MCDYSLHTVATRPATAPLGVSRATPYEINSRFDHNTPHSYEHQPDCADHLLDRLISGRQNAWAPLPLTAQAYLLATEPPRA
jgi:hypothetical protein